MLRTMSVSQSVNQSTHQPASQSINQPAGQSANQPASHRLKHHVRPTTKAHAASICGQPQWWSWNKAWKGTAREATSAGLHCVQWGTSRTCSSFISSSTSFSGLARPRYVTTRLACKCTRTCTHIHAYAHTHTHTILLTNLVSNETEPSYSFRPQQTHCILSFVSCHGMPWTLCCVVSVSAMLTRTRRFAVLFHITS